MTNYCYKKGHRKHYGKLAGYRSHSHKAKCLTTPPKYTEVKSLRAASVEEAKEDGPGDGQRKNRAWVTEEAGGKLWDPGANYNGGGIAHG